MKLIEKNLDCNGKHENVYRSEIIDSEINFQDQNSDNLNAFTEINNDLNNTFIEDVRLRRTNSECKWDHEIIVTIDPEEDTEKLWKEIEEKLEEFEKQLIPFQKSEKIGYKITYKTDDHKFGIPIMIWWANEEYTEDEVFYYNETQWDTFIKPISYQDPKTQEEYNSFITYINNLDLTEVFADFDENEIRTETLGEATITFFS